MKGRDLLTNERADLRAAPLSERRHDAMRELSGAVDMEGRDASVIIYYATAAIAKGSPADAVSMISSSYLPGGTSSARNEPSEEKVPL